MKYMLIILLAVSFAVQRSMVIFKVNAGMSDIVIGILFGILCITYVLKRNEALFSFPPVYVTACICAVVLSGAIVSFSGGGKGAIKEEIQTLEILGIGWIVISFLLGKEKSRVHLMMRMLIIAVGIEVLTVCAYQLVTDNLFSASLLTRNRNTYSMLAMVCAPLISFYAVYEKRKLLKYGCSVILFLGFSTVLSGGALAAGIIGVGILFVFEPARKKAVLFALLPMVLGILLLCVRSEMRDPLKASVSRGIQENFLILDRDAEYIDMKDNFIQMAPQWFSKDTAVRYRRWGYAVKHSGSSVRRLLVGSGPSSFNESLNPYSTDDGTPNIDTNETMMFNIGVSEPDTFSAYTVWLVENGLIGLAALLACLCVPAMIGLRKKGGAGNPSSACGAALLAVVVCNVFHSHMITGMYILAVALIYIAVTDFAEGKGVSPGKEEEAAASGSASSPGSAP